ncbi:hypothetical protein N6H14_16200 [Paenibacillus sp. CC-CFT747]|nr:hypothetical protein N6H14_16200 [Paenibacillus sp. CC-CFT747]
MSIKMKLSLYISVILSIILSANIVLYYYTSRDTLKRDLEGQVRMVAQEIAVVVEQSDRASAYLQEQLGES